MCFSVRIDFRLENEFLQFLPQSWTINCQYYNGVLKRLREKNRKKKPQLWRDNSWFLHHDNAPAHSALWIRKFCAKNQMTVLPRPYSLRLFLVPKIKISSQNKNSVRIEIATNTKTRCNQIAITLKITRCKQFKNSSYLEDYNDCSAASYASLGCSIAE